MKNFAVVVKVVGTHALINASLAAGVTILWDSWKLADAWKHGKLTK